ncbi:MAG TPA: 6-bladed beta-propeller [Longimicrobiales bacterium]|nr:6-bladed beta-propeller [Longimicrobiales bacterium]
MLFRSLALRLAGTLAPALALSVSLAGCGPDGSAASRVEEWAVVDDPRVSIGRLDGSEEELFQSIADAVVTPSGSIVVADRGLAAIRVFDAEGRFAAELGRRGEGPGEFSYLMSVDFFPPDSILAWDGATARLTYFGVDGSLMGTVDLRAGMAAAGIPSLDQYVGRFPDGSLGFTTIRVGPEVGDPDRMTLERFSMDGVHLGRVAEMSGMVRGRRAPNPYSPFPYFAASGEGLYFTSGAGPTVSSLSTGGTEGKIALPPRHGDVDEAWDALPDAVDSLAPPIFRQFLPEAEKPDSLPHYAGLLVDARGRIWTKPFSAPEDALWIQAGGRVRGGAWMVADAEGDPVADVTLPVDFIPLVVLSDRVLGIRVSELGVERIQVLPILVVE